MGQGYWKNERLVFHVLCYWVKTKAFFWRILIQKHNNTISQFNLPELDKDITKNYKPLKKSKVFLADNLSLQKTHIKGFYKQKLNLCSTFKKYTNIKPILVMWKSRWCKSGTAAGQRPRAEAGMGTLGAAGAALDAPKCPRSRGEQHHHRGISHTLWMSCWWTSYEKAQTWKHNNMICTTVLITQWN